MLILIVIDVMYLQLSWISTEIYAAAKETVALAEQRFMSSSHEWQFDNAWQEMLNHATIKVSNLVCD